MKLLAIGLEVNQISAESELKKKFPVISNVQIEFDVDESVSPVRHAYVSIPAHFKKAATDRLRAMEDSDIIEPVTKAPRWISGMSAVPKGKTDFRLVINMRGPNKAIQRQFHQLPRTEEIKTRLNGAKFFTKLDLKSAFHHVELLALQNNNLTLNHDKCEFEKESLKFLGHQLTPQGLNIDDQRCSEISRAKVCLGTEKFSRISLCQRLYPASAKEQGEETSGDKFRIKVTNRNRAATTCSVTDLPSGQTHKASRTFLIGTAMRRSD